MKIRKNSDVCQADLSVRVDYNNLRNYKRLIFWLKSFIRTHYILRKPTKFA